MFKLIFFALFTSLISTNDKNDFYIEKELTHLKELIKNGKFENGFILVKGDTIQTEILRFNRRKNLNPYLFCITKDKTDSIRVYTAHQIDEYNIGQDHYKSYHSENSYFFIHLYRFGKAILFERYEIPSDGRFLYYIKLPNYQNCFVICPNEQNITITSIGGYTEGNNPVPPVEIYNSKKIVEKFKLFVVNYMGDCTSLCNMVQSNYYTINDIPLIIDKYNTCANE